MTLTALLFPFVTVAYEIPKMSLEDLISNSDYVIIGTIESINIEPPAGVDLSHVIVRPIADLHGGMQQAPFKLRTRPLGIESYLNFDRTGGVYLFFIKKDRYGSVVSTNANYGVFEIRNGLIASWTHQQDKNSQAVFKQLSKVLGVKP